MKKTNILVVGSGGREHTLVWKLQQSPLVERVFCAPGNGGTPNNVNLQPMDFSALADFAEENKCFTVVGPEDPLASGIVDTFLERNLKIYGPTREAAVAESSKAWAKQFMERHSIPTAPFRVFDDPHKAMEYVDENAGPVVVKADGLAAGKGVMICNSTEEARNAINSIMIERRFGDSGRKVVLEERLVGEEATYMAIVDTESRYFIPLPSSQDHKRAFDSDEGPNTGGMGAYSPAPVISPEIDETIRTRIVPRFIEGMRAEGIVFKGTLYLGLMIIDRLPYVLEFNIRFGDPELQPILVRLSSDLFPYLQGCVEGRLDEIEEASWLDDAAVCVVMASAGYPGKYEKKKLIRGLDKVGRMSNVHVFHAGTARRNREVITNGGRVLGVTALGSSISNAIKRTYEAVSEISWEGEFHRTDVGAKALKHVSTD